MNRSNHINANIALSNGKEIMDMSPVGNKKCMAKESQTSNSTEIIKRCNYFLNSYYIAKNAWSTTKMSRRTIAIEKEKFVEIFESLYELINNLINCTDIDEIKYLYKQLQRVIAEINYSFVPYTSSFVGVNNQSFDDIYYNTIHSQNDNKNHHGTCGLCSIANALIVLGNEYTSTDILEAAISINACTNKNVDNCIFTNSKMKKIADNGGTTWPQREKIVNYLGFECKTKSEQSLVDILENIHNGYAAIINVNHNSLVYPEEYKQYNITTHAITIVGVEIDLLGNPVGLWVQDTGICSITGNIFYCDSTNYELWKNTPSCVVQYIK